MAEDEFAIQMLKIFIGIILGLFVVIILWHINHNLTTIIVQNVEIINKIK